MVFDGKQYEFIPPEGGWGYLVICGMIISFFCAIGSVPTLGLVFSDFLNDIGATADTVAVIISFYFISTNFSGLITNMLSKRFSKRFIALSGSLFYIFGSILTIFVTTKLELLISYGLLQGIGFGFMSPISFAVFNSYFVQRRSFMMSIACTIMALCFSIYPIMVQFFKHFYGFRGCLVLIAAVNMHTFVAMLVMHPVEWHSKRVTVKKELLVNTDGNVKMLKANIESCEMDSEMVLMPLNAETRQDVRNIDFQKTERKKSIGLWSRIVDFLDLNLMQDPIYVNIALGISFATYADATFTSFQPSYLMNRHYSDNDVATIIASGLGTDLLSRIFYSLASAFIHLKSRDMFLFGVIFMLVARIAFIYVYEFIEIIVVNGIIGFFRAWIYITPNLIFAEHLPLSRFGSGFGLFMFLQGITIVVFGILISWIHNSFDSYTITFFATHSILLLCIVPWIIEKMLIRLR